MTDEKQDDEILTEFKTLTMQIDKLTKKITMVEETLSTQEKKFKNILVGMNIHIFSQ